jgi:hypothetical protein
LEDLGLDGRMIRIGMDLTEIGWEGVDWICLRTGTSGGLL